MIPSTVTSRGIVGAGIRWKWGGQSRCGQMESSGYGYCLGTEVLRCSAGDVVLGSYVRGMSLVARRGYVISSTGVCH